MKRYILPALALSLLASSCNLDLMPENAITYTNAFATEAELNTTTATIHFYMNNCMNAFTPLAKIGLLADETQDDNQLREGNPRSIIEAAADWEWVYKMIFEANLLLDNIGRTQRRPLCLPRWASALRPWLRLLHALACLWSGRRHRQL